MTEQNKDGFFGHTVEDSDRSKYQAVVTNLEDYKRERNGLSSGPILEGEVREPISVVGPLSGTEIETADQNKTILDITSAPNNASIIGHEIHKGRQEKKLGRKAA